NALEFVAREGKTPSGVIGNLVGESPRANLGGTVSGARVSIVMRATEENGRWSAAEHLVRHAADDQPRHAAPMCDHDGEIALMLSRDVDDGTGRRFVDAGFA